MPLKRCSKDGKSGWKWGDSGHCYTGPDAKKKSIKQGLAIETPAKFAAKAILCKKYNIDIGLTQADLDEAINDDSFDYAEKYAIGVILNHTMRIDKQLTDEILEELKYAYANPRSYLGELFPT